MNDPLAYFLTIATYGTWLPGDQRGWVEYRRGWQLPDPVLELESSCLMSEDACILDASARNIVQQQLAETCNHRGWILQAANCRSNHMHAVVTVDSVAARNVRQDLKAWCTRRLKELIDPDRDNWWAERGSIRWIRDEESLDRVIQYVSEAQDLKRHKSAE
ncbi:MAG: transposase [Planctomycetota bacterium]